MRLAWASVQTVVRVNPGAQELEVLVDDGSRAAAVAYTQLSGECQPGDRVLVNTTAVDMGLGTGGSHFVVARMAGGEGVVHDRPSGGHVLKLRYTPLQTDVLAVEAPESEHHGVMADAVSVGGMPVVCCGLHSQVPLVAAAAKGVDSAIRIAYVMTDQASLALPLSQTIGRCRETGLIDATLTSGQSFGGELESVSLHSALLAARVVVGADVAIACIGPGVVGTATRFGHGGIAQGEAINAAAVVGARPVACLRVSFADKRSRHHGVSHHTRAALATVALATSTVAVPELPVEHATTVDDALESAGVWARHIRRDVTDPSTGIDLRGVKVTTMGRGIDQDPSFFSAAFAAGNVAAQLAKSAG